jgi:hypothetical protein
VLGTPILVHDLKQSVVGPAELAFVVELNDAVRVKHLGRTYGKIGKVVLAQVGWKREAKSLLRPANAALRDARGPLRSVSRLELSRHFFDAADLCPGRYMRDHHAIIPLLSPPCLRVAICRVRYHSWYQRR